MDALDRRAVVKAVRMAEPEIIVHQLTALTGVGDYKNLDAGFAMTNRLRTEGADHLLEAARGAGTRQFVAQSYGNWNYARTGATPKTRMTRSIQTRLATSGRRWRQSSTSGRSFSERRASRASLFATATSTVPALALPSMERSWALSASVDFGLLGMGRVSVIRPHL